MKKKDLKIIYKLINQDPLKTQILKDKTKKIIQATEQSQIDKIKKEQERNKLR